MKIVRSAVFCTWLIQAVSAGAGDVCDALQQVRRIPFKNESVGDPALDEILRAGEKAIPCLVERLTDTTPMPDPRSAPPAQGFVVGDLASMLLCDVTGRLFEDQLPLEVRATFKERGVDAYFDYVQIPENRVTLRRNWEEWLKERKKNSKP